MASTCGSTLSLMDAGVPIKAPVAGIAMGLIVKDEKKFAVLTDIVGLEDGNGDMDLKVAGTKDGITVLQLDVKTLKLSLPMLTKALEQAKDARLKILKVMQKVIKDSRSGVSEHAPKIKKLKIDKAKIGEVIGPGGKIIRGIIAQTGAQIDVEDDGTVIVSATKENEVADAISIIEGLTKDVLPGEIYEGEVKRLEKFGIFVEILPGKDGMVHISDMSNEYVNDPSDIVSLGDNIKVKVKEIDNLGRINLTMKLDSSSSSSKSPKPSGERYGRRAPRGRGTRDNRSNRNPRGRRDARGSSRQSGPHFPATRYVKQDR
jgi:polyribonucleotide nucleotidyltransferase